MKIRKITTAEQTIDSYNEVVSDFLFSEQHYNDNGHLILHSEFDESGEVVTKQIFEVDDLGNILVQMNYERANSLIERTEFHDDEDGYQVQSEITTSSGHKTFHEYEYTQLGNVQKIVIKNEAGQIEAFELFVMNDQGQVTEEIRQNAEGAIEFKKVVTYYGHGGINVERYYDRDTPVRIVTHRYDDRNRIAEKEEEELYSGSKTVTRYQYDLAGNEIQNETFYNGQLTFRNFCLYDDHNSLVEERIMSLGTDRYIRILTHEIDYNNA